MGPDRRLSDRRDAYAVRALYFRARDGRRLKLYALHHIPDPLPIVVFAPPHAAYALRKWIIAHSIDPDDITFCQPRVITAQDAENLLRDV